MFYDNNKKFKFINLKSQNESNSLISLLYFLAKKVSYRLFFIIIIFGLLLCLEIIAASKNFNTKEKNISIAK